jgi:transcriptional regulator with XRE-family HTH domain
MDVDASLPRETGQRVRDARKRRKLSRRRVAINAGFSVRELAAVERGRRALGVDELRSLSGSIGVEIDDLVPDGYVVEERPPTDDIRIEDLLTPVAASPDLEAALRRRGHDDPGTEPVERRKVPIASAQLARAFADLRASSEAVTRCCALVQSADVTDDLPALHEMLRRALAKLEEDASFAANVTRYQDARDEYLRAARDASAQSWRARATRPATGNPLA